MTSPKKFDRSQKALEGTDDIQKHLNDIQGIDLDDIKIGMKTKKKKKKYKKKKIPSYLAKIIPMELQG